MRFGNGFLAVAAVLLLAWVFCSGAWSPLALMGAAGTLLAKVKVGGWLLLSLVALCAGPLILLSVFAKGPPDRRAGAQVACAAVAVLAGIALTVSAMFKLPLMFAVLATLFLAV